MKQYFHIYRLTNGNDRDSVNNTVMKYINDGWTIKQMEHIPSTVESKDNNVVFAASLAILFEKEETGVDDGRD